MCPLRFILIFLSATLAGFLVLRNLRSQPHTTDVTELEDANSENEHTTLTSDAASPSLNHANATSKVETTLFHFFLFVLEILQKCFFKKNPNDWWFMHQVWGALLSGFWTFLDMASGRYLWKQLVSSSSPKPEWTVTWHGIYIVLMVIINHNIDAIIMIHDMWFRLLF